ncbi:putative ubiquitin elongating factor core [Lyophyllum shimeji]|uniref:RING-type E3 ubiquitin transferase n=1 Tax=Lyophyllum shimeji TaxID=47721 RepID=A0A9P3PME3_LYOSH|nr:putative ubiquitin elongating factor core [Lyophyllum shimeji]
MSENPASTPQDDAERIRLKRLAKLQSAEAPRISSPAAPSVTPSPSPQPKPAPPKPTPTPSSSKAPTPATTPIVPSPVPTKKPVGKLDIDAWEHDSVGYVFKATLDRSVAEKTGYETVWLKQLAEELESEGTTNVRLSADLADRLLIARLELDPRAMSDDLEFLPVLASLPAGETVFEYLVGAWKRLNVTRSALLKKGYSPPDTQAAVARLEKLRELIISYAGLTLQEPEMFPQPEGRPLGPPELIAPLLSLSALSAPLLATPSTSPNTLTPSDIEQFLQDLARRFEPENEIDGVLGPVVKGLLFHESLFRPEGLAGGDSSWRGVVGGLEALVSVKAIAKMITRMEEWNPPNATAANFEKISLLGPLCRLGVFSREWPILSQSYFSEPEKRTRDDVESSFASLRGTLKSLQSSLFQIFNTLVRASPESREAVLQYFARVISLNSRRAGMQVDPDTVASDSFMVNLQSVLLRFAEPFMDANYSKMDRIDPLFFAHSSRIDLKDETRIKATSEEAAEWETAHRDPMAPEPNFISNIFYLTIAMSHYGYLKTIQTYNNLAKHLDDLQRHLDMINGDGSWQGTPLQIRVEAAINQVKKEQAKIRSQQLAYEAQLTDPEFVFRSLGFTNFLSTWLIRQADPNKSHPNPPVQIPLPKDVPMAFRVLPEYIVEDIVEHLFFVVQTSPDKFELAGKIELMTFVLAFLNSTWYIKNPFLKSKINDVLFMSIWGYGRERHGILGNLLNTHPMALKHLMPALMHFYIEVEQTGASSQFYDKFNARRNISYILKVVWDNPTHREALNIEARNVDKFVRFVNLMINDVTYLMDESLSELTQIHNIQVEMDDRATWESKPLEYRREREGTLRSLERHASGYTTLGRSTVELLKIFTAETKAPFMMPEIVNRLAAMLDYNLVALVGPKYQELKVREPEKLKFNPRALLSDILQVFLNLSDQPDFINAVAGDARSYSKALFDNAAEVATRRSLKTVGEVEMLRAFVAKVEVAKSTMQAEDEELEDIPDEFLDPLMATVMRDPVRLPSSRAIVDRSTIKSHLLSDTTDPFNRAPLSIEDVLPDVELKARIDAYLIERRRNRANVVGQQDVNMA